MKRNKKIIIVIFAVVICAVVAVGALLYTKHIDKQQFIEARQTQDAIVAELPRATSITKNDFCQHLMQKWESQGNYCNVTSKFTVDKADFELVNTSIAKVANNFGFTQKNMSTSTQDKSTERDQIYHKNKLECMFISKFNNESTKVDYELICYARTKFDHYKVIKL